MNACGLHGSVDRRELIKRVLQGKRSERLPRALFGAGRWSYRQAGLKIEELVKDPVFFARSLGSLFARLDTDIVFAGSGLNTFPAEALGGVLAMNGDQAPLLSFPLIEKADDARSLDQVDICHSPSTLALIRMIASLRQSLPDRFLCATSWGPFTWAMILCEWNFLRERTATDKAFIREICELGLRLTFAFLDPLMEQGLVDGIAIPDGAVTLIPHDVYREVVLPCERKLFDRVRERGFWGILHQCGDIRSQLPLYPESGADCISLDASVSLAEAFRLYGDRVVLAGNVDVINTVFGGDPALLCKAVSERVSGVPDPYRNFILMPSCDLPPDTPLRNVEEFLACADRVV